MKEKDAIKACKHLIKSLDLNVGDFYLYKTRTKCCPEGRRYTWYNVALDQLHVSLDSPNYGRMQAYTKYSFIIDSIFKMSPNLRNIESKKGIIDKWEFAESINDDEIPNIRKVFFDDVQNALSMAEPDNTMDIEPGI